MIPSNIVTQKTSPEARSEMVPYVFVVDDDISVRESLEPLIRSAGWHAETFASGREFLDRPSVAAPNCLILDISLPDMNGLELQRRFANVRSSTPIIFITGSADIPTTVCAMKAGAVEFLTKPLHDDVLLDAVANAVELSRAELRRETETAALRKRSASLTPREAEVMTLVVAGRLNKQIAAELGISEITVKAHRGKMMRKMSARSVPDLVKMAATLGITA
jgi:FixJ family two-component response regulator